MDKRKTASNKVVEVRTLYECSYARVRGGLIYCHKEHPIDTQTGSTSIRMDCLARGRRLAMANCQECLDFKSMGPPVPEKEKGWINKATTGDPHER